MHTYYLFSKLFYRIHFVRSEKGGVFEFCTNDILSQVLGTLEYFGRVWAKGHDVGIQDFFLKPQGGLRSLHKRQLQYEVDTWRKYEKDLEDLKARMKAMKDMCYDRQSVPTDHQTAFHYMRYMIKIIMMMWFMIWWCDTWYFR